jgi:hypothetical protein
MRARGNGRAAGGDGRSPPPATPRPAGGLAATVAGLALLAAAAGCSSGGSGNGASDSKAAGPPKGIQVPAKIASLKKVSDTPDQEFKDSGIASSVRKNLHSVYYRDSADDRHRWPAAMPGRGVGSGLTRSRARPAAIPPFVPRTWHLSASSAAHQRSRAGSGACRETRGCESRGLHPGAAQNRRQAR